MRINLCISRLEGIWNMYLQVMFCNIQTLVLVHMIIVALHPHSKMCLSCGSIQTVSMEMWCRIIKQLLAHLSFIWHMSSDLLSVIKYDFVTKMKHLKNIISDYNFTTYEVHPEDLLPCIAYFHLILLPFLFFCLCLLLLLVVSWYQSCLV